MKNKSFQRRADDITDGLNTDIRQLVLDSYDLGHEEGYQQGVDEIDDNYREKIGVEYAVEAFKECKTLEDFQDKQRELTNLACTFMPTLGLKR